MSRLLKYILSWFLLLFTCLVFIELVIFFKPIYGRCETQESYRLLCSANYLCHSMFLFFFRKENNCHYWLLWCVHIGVYRKAIKSYCTCPDIFIVQTETHEHSDDFDRNYTTRNNHICVKCLGRQDRSGGSRNFYTLVKHLVGPHLYGIPGHSPGKSFEIRISKMAFPKFWQQFWANILPKLDFALV